MRWIATFDRIGRNHDIRPLPVEGSWGEIADQIYDYARPHLASREIDIAIHDDGTHGFIAVGGFRNGGNFTLADGAIR